MLLYSTNKNNAGEIESKKMFQELCKYNHMFLQLIESKKMFQELCKYNHMFLQLIGSWFIPQYLNLYIFVNEQGVADA